MEFILISEEKLKIILSKEEMTEFEMSPDDFDYSKISTKHILWSVLNKAHNETGFDADKCKLFVQVYASKDGGCEIYISKIRKEQFEHNTNTYYEKDNTSSGGYFLSLGFDNLISLCNRLNNDKIKYHTILYYNDIGLYVLILKPKKRFPSYYKEIEVNEPLPDYLTEYGRINKLDDYTENYFEEHYIKIADGNAAELLSVI